MENHLLNGNVLKIRPTVQNKEIRITNICGVDSFLELVASSCENYKEFGNFVRNAVNQRKDQQRDFFKLALLYLKKGPCKKVYDERGEFCVLYYLGLDETVPDAGFACTSIIQKLVKDCNRSYDLYSAKVDATCHNPKCNFQKTRKDFTLEIPNNLIWKQGISSLEVQIKKKLEGKIDHFSCIKCCNPTVSEICQLGEVIAIDTELIYRSNVQENAMRHNIEVKEPNVNPTDMPIEMKFGDRKYVLSGFIEFLPPAEGINVDVGHYVAWCRTAGGKWILKNDEDKNVRIYLDENIRTVQPVLILYVRQ